MDSSVRQLDINIPEDVIKIAREKCRAGDHGYNEGRYRGDNWSGSDLANHLGLTSKYTWIGERECFFCGKKMRILVVNDIRYEWEI